MVDKRFRDVKPTARNEAHDKAGTQGSAENKPPKSDLKTKCCARTRKKGDRGFIEGCLFALCCCWLCDACFDVSVVAG